ncbi:clotting factor C-like [Choristoneura fumiferana]|uniref:clotting factor C-like n=1 Tax=Choristoneura fumiferana TaxID=7141 RepID=UPI003D1567B7
MWHILDFCVKPNAAEYHVSEIKIPFRYLGDAGHHQEDIALVFMSTPVVYHTYIRPVCIDFDDDFDRNQLQDTNSGKVSGWGLTAADGPASSLLLTTDLPYVNGTKCMDELPPGFKPYLTSDKFCAGTKNGTTVCQGDSGGGLVFPSVERGIRRYYLRGVVSTAPRSEHACNVNTYATFTHIQFHATFIRDYGLGVVSGPAENGTREYTPPDRARRVAPDGCPYLAPGRTTEPTGIKSWDSKYS